MGQRFRNCKSCWAGQALSANYLSRVFTRLRFFNRLDFPWLPRILEREKKSPENRWMNGAREAIVVISIRLEVPPQINDDRSFDPRFTFRGLISAAPGPALQPYETSAAY